ncbi:hypothetical protein D3C72_2193250 [compost metagenome]
MLNNLPVKTATLTEYRIDADNSNAYEVWKKMGSPQNPDSKQIALLEKAGQLKMVGKPVKHNNLKEIGILLPRQGVSFLKLDW